ncbi:DUF2147 domain-containing protein [Sphingomonas sp. SAFR-052]|uniref:DUF2147 domain-containing protein n=1 Tax=Sphingomonas sp. SAFR-052 TaxID=3436867 RepID=UPI003F80E705
MNGIRATCRWLAILAAALAVPASAAEAPAGLWISPHHDVAVRTAPCGDRLCGWVVWASATAEADARAGGTDRLIGTELLEDYRADGRGTWSGTVFVPDMGRRFSSRIELATADRLQIRGCLIGDMLCRTQRWTRIAQVPHG